MAKPTEIASPKLPFRQRWIPHPLLTGVMILLWVAMANNFGPGGWLLGTLLGLAIPLLTQSIWDTTPKIASYGNVLIYALVVLWDVLVANIEVALLILFKSPRDLRPQWITVPLDLRSREGIAVLAGTVTLTPGTVSCDLSADGRSMLVHCLDARDTEEIIRRIKTRYEARLLRIFR